MFPRVREIIDVLFEDEDPSGAIDVLLSYYDDYKKQAVAIYGLWSSVRGEIIKHDKYKNPNYEDEIMDLCKDVGPADKEKLYDILNSPLRERHRAYMMKRRYLWDKDFDKKFKTIKPVNPLMYEFDLPDQLKEWKTSTVYKRNVARQHHMVAHKSDYKMSEYDADLLIEKCIGILNSPITSSKVYYDNVFALLILSGRRNYEILRTLDWAPASHMYQVNVCGLCKKKGIGEREDPVCTIPLLCTYDLFAEGMKKVRNYKDLSDYDLATLNGLSGQSIKRASKRIAGRVLDHTKKRNIYSEMAWKRRDTENHYLIGEQSCSKHVWIQHALCHEFSISDTTRYQIMNIE